MRPILATTHPADLGTGVKRRPKNLRLRGGDPSPSLQGRGAPEERFGPRAVAEHETRQPVAPTLAVAGALAGVAPGFGPGTGKATLTQRPAAPGFQRRHDWLARLMLGNKIVTTTS